VFLYQQGLGPDAEDRSLTCQLSLRREDGWGYGRVELEIELSIQQRFLNFLHIGLSWEFVKSRSLDPGSL
jgi:hypothetical protein